MGVLKKGSRVITVDNQTYRWRVRHKPTYTQGICQSNLVVAVEAENSAGSKLIVKLPQLHPSNWMEESSKAVLPSDIKSYVLQALSVGWRPQEKGEPFVIRIR